MDGYYRVTSRDDFKYLLELTDDAVKNKKVHLDDRVAEIEIEFSRWIDLMNKPGNTYDYLTVRIVGNRFYDWNSVKYFEEIGCEVVTFTVNPLKVELL